MALTQPLSSLLINGVHTFATCWILERTDGLILRYTDHNSPIIFQSQTYVPIGSVAASARQKVEGIQKAQNLELKGFIASDDITYDDLRAGRYREAMITEFLVDWNYPYTPFLTQTYWIVDTTFDGETWTASVAGLLSLLRQRIGKLHTRACGAILGDADCGINLDTYTVTGTVSSVVTSRRKFQSDLTTQADDYFAIGLITWNTGLNAGLSSEVKTYAQSGGTFEIQLVTPFNIQIGDTFDVYPGCNHLSGIGDTTGHCKNKFNNLLNYMGDPYIPGTDAVLATPDNKG